MGTSRRAILLVAALTSPSLAEPGDKPLPEAKDVQRSKYESKTRADKGDTLRKASGSKTSITQEDIQRAQPDNAGEMLRRVPGLQVRQEDQTGFRLNLGVRGLSPTRSRLVLVEEDGVPVVVSPYGEPELYYMTSVERIKSMDVVKGSDVLRYGPQTVGAVIQLHTFDPTPTPTFYAGGTGGTQGYYSVLGRYANTTDKGIGYVAQAYYKRGDGFRQMGFSAADGMAKVTIPTSSSSDVMIKVGAHYDMTDTTYTGLTEGMYMKDPRQATAAPYDRFGIQRYELAITYDKRFGHGDRTTKLHTAFFAYEMTLFQRSQDFDRSPMKVDGNPVPYASSPDPFLNFRYTDGIRNRTYGVLGASEEIEQRFKTGFVRHRLTAGVRLMSDNAHRVDSQGLTPTSNSGMTLSDTSSYIFGLGAWVEHQMALTDWLLVTPAFRYEHSNLAQASRVNNDNETMTPVRVHSLGHSSADGSMPGIGVIVGKPALNVFTSFYLGYSGPRIGQSINPEGADQKLHPEHSNNWELGMRARKSTWLSAEADTFLINFDNQLVSNNPLTNASGAEFVDGGRTQHIGAEGTATVRFGRAFKLPVDIDLSGHYTFVRSRFVGGFSTGDPTGIPINGKTVPYSPAQTAVATLDIAHRLGIGGQVAFQYVGSQYTDEVNTVAPDPTGLTGRIPAYTTLDFALRYREPKTGLGIALSMKNALNRVYISDRLPNGIFTAGFREVLATLSWASGS